MKTDRDYLREATERILRNDPELNAKVKKADKSAFTETAKAISRELRKRSSDPELVDEALESAEFVDSRVTTETVVQKLGRPSLLVQDGKIQKDDPLLVDEIDIWSDRLFTTQAQKSFDRVIPAVGRIELANSPRFEWVGTGWLTEDNIVVTNRHVAKEFAERSGDAFRFSRGFPDPGTIKASIDFLEEHQRSKDLTFTVKDVLYIADDDGPDIAFLKVELPNGGTPSLPSHLNLATGNATALDYVATLGYPAADSRVPDQDLVRKFFGNIYNKKRLAPGQVLTDKDDLLTHDCSTLGGNSGSCVVQIETGQVLGLHFSGIFLRENRAVPARVILEELERLQRPPRPQGNRRPPSGENQNVNVGASGLAFTFQIPLEVSIAIGKAIPLSPPQDS